MTIVVGILCTDGIVVASDSMGSLNLGNTNFVAVNTKKITSISDNLLIGSAGSNDIMNMFIHYLRCNENVIIGYHDEQQFINQIQKGFFQFYCATHIYPLMQSMPQQLQSQTFIDEQLKFNDSFDSIIGYRINGNPFMGHIKGSIQNPSLVYPDHKRWDAIIGSGVLTGLPSIHLIKKILNLVAMPNLKEAITLAYWTIDHAKQASSGGIGGDIIINVIDCNNNKSYNVDCTETAGEIQSLYNKIHEFRLMKNDEKEIAPTL